MKTPKTYVFVIDTDSYAGNFEREMCAYLTGQIGDCGVGEELQAVARKELDKKSLEEFDDLVIGIPDEHGCNRPCEIWVNPNWFNDGRGGHWKKTDKDVKKQVKRYIDEVKQSINPFLAEVEGHLKNAKESNQVLNWTIDACERQIKSYKKEIEDAERMTKPNRYPAYNSVGIHFSERPSIELIAVMKERSYKFAEAYKKHSRMKEFRKDFKLEIEGFRLVWNVVKENEESL